MHFVTFFYISVGLQSCHSALQHRPCVYAWAAKLFWTFKNTFGRLGWKGFVYSKAVVLPCHRLWLSSQDGAAMKHFVA